MTENQKKRKCANKSNLKLINKLMKRDGAFCNWCAEPVVRFRDVQWQYAAVIKNDKAVWTQKGIDCAVRYATVDHVKPISEGGDIKSMENLVIACPKCNRDRTEAPCLPKLCKGSCYVEREL